MMAWDPVRKAAQVLDGMIKVTSPQVRGAHDSQMVIVRGRAYIVYEANDVRPGESGDWPFVYCAMSAVDVREKKLLDVIGIARPGQRFANAALKPGACFVPRILIKDASTLRVFFVSMEPGVRQAETYYRDFSLDTGVFEDSIYPMHLETCLGSFPMEPRHFHAQARAQGFTRPESDSCMYMFDIDKTFDGVRYVALNNFDTKQNALGMFNDELDTVTVIGNYNEPESALLSESAISRLPDGRWIALIRSDAPPHNSMFAVSENGKDWSAAEEQPVVTDGSNSKPIIEHIAGAYLLGWQQQPYRTRFNIDVSPDFISWKRAFAFDNAEFSLQYPSLYEYEGMVYICGTHGSVGISGDQRDSIWFGALAEASEIAALCAEK